MIWIFLIHSLRALICFSICPSTVLLILELVVLENSILSSKSNSDVSLINLLFLKLTLFIKKLNNAGVYKNVFYLVTFILRPISLSYPYMFSLFNFFKPLSKFLFYETKFRMLKLLSASVDAPLIMFLFSSTIRLFIRP